MSHTIIKSAPAIRGAFARHNSRSVLPLTACLLLIALATMVGCAANGRKQNQEFFTSGSREADQRASQRMARDEQHSGSDVGSEKGVKKATLTKPSPDDPFAAVTNKPAQVEGKLTLFDRLGGQPGISNIVADFTPRVLHDPRVNWQRKG